MRAARTNFRLFLQSAALTLLLLVPVTATVVFFAEQRSQQLALRQAAQEQAGVPIEAGSRNIHRLLLTVQSDTPEFLLMRIDAPARSITLCAVPPQALVQAPIGQTTLAECCLAAGPARAAQLLAATVGAAPDGYLAATPATWSGLLDKELTLRLDTTPLLSAGTRRALGLATDPMVPLTPQSSTEFLKQAREAGADRADLRAQLWAAWLRQYPGQLAGLADAARQSAARTLTDLPAPEQAEIGQALGYLSTRADLQVTAQALPVTDAAAGQALTEEALAAAAALLG